MRSAVRGLKQLLVRKAGAAFAAVKSCVAETAAKICAESDLCTNSSCVSVAPILDWDQSCSCSLVPDGLLQGTQPGAALEDHLEAGTSPESYSARSSDAQRLSQDTALTCQLHCLSFLSGCNS